MSGTLTLYHETEKVSHNKASLKKTNLEFLLINTDNQTIFKGKTYTYTYLNETILQFLQTKISLSTTLYFLQTHFYRILFFYKT